MLTETEQYQITSGDERAEGAQELHTTHGDLGDRQAVCPVDDGLW